MIHNEIGHFLRRIMHTLPIISVTVRLILNGKTPNINPFCAKRIDVLTEKQGPRIVVLFFEFTAYVVIVVLHPRCC